MNCKNHAFTLVELLVVVAIIALLMSITVAAVTKVKKQTKDTLCLARLRHWGLIFKLYCDENDGKFVPNSHFTDNARLMELAVYEKMRYCPLATRTMGKGDSPFAITNIADSSYTLNLWINNHGSGGRAKELCWLSSNVRAAWKIPMFMDSSYNDECDVTPHYEDQPPDYDGQLAVHNYNEMRRVCINRHNEGINCAFLDFSARRVAIKELWQLEWHRDWNSDNEPPPVWPDWMKNMKDYY
jgi:prepilin-type N-terminal cleavage/methylation domain-containing protein/prepilin-type processing-associated H-X9-DG protein